MRIPPKIIAAGDWPGIRDIFAFIFLYLLIKNSSILVVNYVPNLGTYILFLQLGHMKTIYSPEAKRLSSWLREQREAKGLTMRQAGELIQKPHSFIGKIEVGQRRLDVVEFVWYCECLGFDPVEGLVSLRKKHYQTW